MFTVELWPHKGVRKTALGMAEVVLPQDRVIIHYQDENGDDKLLAAGYVSHNKVAHVSLTVKNLTQDQLQEIKRQVDKLREAKGLPATTRISQLRSIEENQYKVVTQEDASELEEDDI